MQRRHLIYKDVTITTALGTSTEILISEFASGQISIAADDTVAYYARTAPGGTFYPAQDTAGAAITQTINAGKSYPMPAALFGAYSLKIVGGGNGTVSMCLKS